MVEAARYGACAARVEAARYGACAARVEAARYGACAARVEAARYGACAARQAPWIQYHHQRDLNSNFEVNEGEMRKIIVLVSMLLPAAVLAQAPAAAAQAPKETPAAAPAVAGRV